MLKANAVDGVVQFNVYTQVVAIKLKFVARAQACVFVKICLERGHHSVVAELPVFVLGWAGLVVNAVGVGHGGRPCVLNFCCFANILHAS